MPAVVPQAISPETGDALPLEDLVRDVVERAPRGAIAITGGAGSGKTTALRHLESRLPGPTYLDIPAIVDATEEVVVYTTITPLPLRHLAVFRLARWGQDEWIEYLLAKHPARCASVMARIDDRALAGGNAELWRTILDEMAADETVGDVRSALRRSAERLKRHAPVRLLRRAQEVANQIRQRILPLFLDRSVVEETARLADGVMIARLLEGAGDLQPMCASILHAAGARWRPRDTNLRNAYLDGVQWPGIQLAGADLDDAHLRRADLSEARLDGMRARGAHLRRARLDGASLRDLDATDADLFGARLRHARAPWGNFTRAILERADLEGALLEWAAFLNANLAGARLTRCDLTGARLDGATIREADFRGADLTFAHLPGLDLRTADFTGAVFHNANLTGCRLSGMRLPGANFELARLVGAGLTGAAMPHGSFRGAWLRDVRAADVDWERANLRDADLSGANFHLGSTRSGRIDSPFASEGTRTGYYSDDFSDQHFKAPEEIRKANLRGADLRGAILDNVDFYLVDLRDAKYDDEQAKHFRRCGAILEARA